MSDLAKLLQSESETPAALEPAPAPVLVKKVAGFWPEFFRVEFDKMILIALILFLWKVGAVDSMKYAIGGLIVAINHNRFKWN